MKNVIFVWENRGEFLRNRVLVSLVFSVNSCFQHRASDVSLFYHSDWSCPFELSLSFYSFHFFEHYLTAFIFIQPLYWHYGKLDGATFHLQVENLATIWCLIHCLHILVTRWSYVHWLHHLHCFQSWPPDCVTALPHCLELPHWHYQLVLSWYPHQPESHQLSLNKVAHSLTHGHPDPKIGPQVYLGPIKICTFLSLSLLPAPVVVGNIQDPDFLWWSSSSRSWGAIV